jgi:hypothetical protein
VALDPPNYPFLLTQVVQDVVARCFDEDLLGLQPEVPSDVGTVTAINNLISKIIKQGLTAINQVVQDTAKTLDCYFGQGVVLFAQITHARVMASLLPLYFDIAASNKKTKQLTIEEWFCAKADN